MADFVFNIAKGKAGYYATLPGTNDALIAVPIEATGLESDATLMDYDTLAVILAAANNEQTTVGRKTMSTVVGTVDDTNNRLDVDFADFTWTGASGNALGAIIICYDPDTTTGTDSDLIPLTKHDFAYTPNGGDITAQVATAGFYRAA
jgi:hypothetical protein